MDVDVCSNFQAKLIQLAERTILVMTSQKGIQVSTIVAHGSTIISTVHTGSCLPVLTKLSQNIID